MLDSLTLDNFRDFSQRYQGTYGWLLNEAKNGKVLVYIRKVEENRVTFMDITGRDFHANAGQQVTFEFLPVTRGWFYSEDGKMCLLSRKPARQWHRGICPANTNIAVVSLDRLRGIDYGLEELHAIFEVKKTHPYQCGSTTIWSKQFATIANVLHLYDRHIGKYVPDTKAIVLDKDGQFLKQEVMDVINRNNYGVDVQ